VTQTVFKIGEIRELIRLLDETSVAELKIETDDMKLHLKKPESNAQPVLQMATVAQAPTHVPVVAAMPQATSATAFTPAEVATPAEDANVHWITSPMVGTFYRSPSPDSPAFADRGTVVNEKSIVCIVEAMKLMNEIESEVNGEVLDVVVQNGQLVEYGQPLFKIKLA
jgi:acetyl-CoA carboxylase biotin carboxyl carrier protein